MEDFQKIKDAVEKRMFDDNIHPDVVHSFVRNVKKVYDGFSGKISFDDIKEPDLKDLIFYKELITKIHSKKDLNRLVVIKLNGGLGSSMGLSRAKSIIPVKDNKNFLEITLNQLRILRRRSNIAIPLIFMNSFNTREDTLNIEGVRGLNMLSEFQFPEDFLQNRVPKLYRDSLMPVGDGKDPGDWCPPGHGDIYLSLKDSGLLDRLIEAGKDIAFVSNADNLGAALTSRILSEFIKHNLEFAMEVTAKTASDLKGGIPVKRDGYIELLEIAQVHDANVKDFQDIKRFSYFNTNNIWIHLPTLRKKLESNMDLPLIVNHKEYKGENIIQLETAMGAAIGLFENTRAFVVPRKRFAPVKTCADLLVRRSDAYTMEEKSGLLKQNPLRDAKEVHVVLDDIYKKIENFDRYFTKIPSLLHAKSLRVMGPVHFDIPVNIFGDVVIENPGKAVRKISEIGKIKFENETYTF